MEQTYTMDEILNETKWTTAEIVYCSISGILMLMALAEIVAFTGSLSYSFIKVHLKAKAAGQRGVQYLSLVMMFILVVFKILFLGAMFSLIPVPHWQGMSNQPLENHKFIPPVAITISQFIAFALVALLLLMPTVVSIHQLISSPKDIKERIEAIRATSTFPRVLIVMPVYNELPEVLHTAICSAIDGDYPKEHLHIFISFDNDATSDLYRALIRSLGVPADGDYYPPVLDLYYRGVQITVSRFPHGGKRLTQKKTFGLINSIYKEYPDKTDHLFVLFIDSDIVLPASTIANFVWDMELKPNSKNLLAMTGVITVTTKDDITFLNLLQDIEYVHGQFIGRAIESAVGGCVTLPGALTIFRYSAFLESYDEYFAERKVSDLWDFGRSHLGEDRYLTHLLMTKAKQTKLIQFCHRATCKTEPVREWRNLMKQRRRWFLGFLTNEGAFLSDPKLWRKYPWLLAFRLIQDIVTGTSMVSYVTIMAVITGMAHWSIFWLGLLVAYFILNWGLMFTYGLWLGRYKAGLYPLMFFIGPFVSWFLLVYGVITANERTWGGPRADAAKTKEDDLEAGENDNEKDDNMDQEGLGEGEIIEYTDEEVELPDHLFYPQRQEPVRRRRYRRVRRGPPTKRVDCYKQSPYSGGIDMISTAEPKQSRIARSIRSRKNEVQYDSGDDASDEGSELEVDVLRVSEKIDGDYFSPQPVGFASSALLKKDTQWWDDDKHLSNLGIIPFTQQPKIPGMFASVETLILTPMAPATPSGKARSIRSVRSSRSIKHFALPPAVELSGRDSVERRDTPSRPKQKQSMPSLGNTRSAPGTPKMKPATIVRSTPNSPKVGPSRGVPTRSAPGTPKMKPVSNSKSAPGTPKVRPVSTFITEQSIPITSKSRPETPNDIPRPLSAPGTPKRRPQSIASRSRRGSQVDINAPLTHSRRRSIHGTTDNAQSSSANEPMPPPSFCYVPADYYTPSHSAPATPKMSPVILPSPRTSRPTTSDSCSSTPPPLPSPRIPLSNLPNPAPSSSRDSDDILSAALAVLNPSEGSSSGSTSNAAKRLSSRSRTFMLGENVPPVPAIPNRIQSSSSGNRGSSSTFFESTDTAESNN
ncbi:hypothetical protein BGZ76_010811 [Entomortierella beljakovae]|nr:hypothetical protein BGZ76_010811 [Entomortierella beljakovae]